MRTVLVFEDHRAVDLYPISIGKLLFTTGCGSYRLIDQLEMLGIPLRALVRPHLQSLLAADFPQLCDGRGGATAMVVNARLVPSVRVAEQLAAILAASDEGVVYDGEDLACAISSRLDGRFTAESIAARVAELRLPVIDAALPLMRYPHDVIRHHLTTLGPNLEHRLATGSYREVADGVFVAQGVTLGDPIVSDTRQGPIVIEENASIGPYVYLQGPAHIGPSARVIEHSAIKDAVALGHTTKIGGEVEASIIEPYTNKQHHGFIGHSFLGSWINLGAGTCNSDLKNTYGQVKMQYGAETVATGMQFVGSIIGDYSKTAINTGIFTGKTIGACTMVYGFVTTNVPSFVNYARLFGQVTATPVEVLVATQARMFARRNVVQRPCDIQLLHDMHELTRHQRELGSVPLEPLSL